MADNTCFSSVQACRLRVARLDATGKPLAGAKNLYVTDALIEIGIKMIIKSGTRLEQANGCGNDCVIFQDCDRITGVDLQMQLCQLDAELMEMLCGGTLLVSGGNTVGYMVPADNAACSNGVSIEVFSKAWNVDQQAINAAGTSVGYYQFGFPKTTWVPGDFTLSNGVLAVPFTGKGYANAQFDNGPANDWVSYAIDNCMAWQINYAALPASTCGATSLVAS